MPAVFYFPVCSNFHPQRKIMVPKIMQSTPMEPKGVSVLASASTPWLIRTTPTTKSKAPLLRMRTLVERSFFSRALRVWLGSSQRGPSANEASHRGQTSRGFTTAIPHCGHLRVRAIGAKVGESRAIRQRCILFEN